jgi:hypothetical protein
MIAVGVALFAIVVAGKAIGASRAVTRELRSHLEREGWSSLRSPFFTLRPGFRGSWQGREARGSFQPRQKSKPPLILIDVSTRQFERMRISRASSSRLAAIANFAFGLPPRVDTGDQRFDARAGSREAIEMILRDGSTTTLLDEFLRSTGDRIDSKNGTLKLLRELQDRRSSGVSLSFTFRPPAEEIERSVFLAHRILEALSTKGF